LSTTTPQPSPRTNPSAEASNVRHFPEADSIFDRQAATVPRGERIRLTPPTSVISDSPLRRLPHARCTASSEDAHAASTTMLGPCSPSTYDTRPAAAFRLLPVM